MEMPDRKSVSETKTTQRNKPPDTTNLQRPRRDAPCCVSYLAKMTARPNTANITKSSNAHVVIFLVKF